MSQPKSKSILIVFTSANKDLEGGQTGWYLPEAAHPYYVFEPHFNIDFCSPNGPNPPVDEDSVAAYTTDTECVNFLSQDPVVREKFASAKRIADVDSSAYDVIFYVGGRGPVLDLAFDEDNKKLGEQFYNSNRITAAVCHGPVALNKLTTPDGKSIFSGGKKFTGFSNAEEEIMKTINSIPILLEDKLQQLGGKFFKADKPFDPKVIVDGNLYTGQNPNSARPLAEEVLKALLAQN